MRGRHTRQGSKYKLARGDDPDGLVDNDLLQLHREMLSKKRDDALQFETSRDSRMCLVLDVRDNAVDNLVNTRAETFEMDSPPGYSMNLGMASWDSDFPLPNNGPLSASEDKPPSQGYVVCKELPAGLHKLTGARALGAPHNVYIYSVLFAEVDGSAPALSDPPPGWSGPEIQQHEKCPDELHDMWAVDGPDPNDSATSAMKWATWHPQVDCIYNCYYGHEHGSFGGLAGYTERFHYVAYKNEEQDESHEGFKTYVMPVGDKFVVVNLHSNTKDFSRMNVDLHTMVVAVTDKTSGKLLSEISCKSSSGGASADYYGAGKPHVSSDEPKTLPMGDSASKQRIIDMWAMKSDRQRVMKRINLFDPNNKNPKLRFEGGQNDANANMRGVYEGWFMRGLGPYCMSASEQITQVGPAVDIKNTHNGCMDEACTKKIIFGLVNSNTYPGIDGFYPNFGNDRFIEMKGLRIAPDLCELDLPEPNADGYRVFYTNPTCDELCEGPGPKCIMQRVHNSFDGVSTDGIYVTNDAHGHFTYVLAGANGELDSHDGIAQVEGALGIDVEMP